MGCLKHLLNMQLIFLTSASPSSQGLDADPFLAELLKMPWTLDLASPSCQNAKTHLTKSSVSQALSESNGQFPDFYLEPSVTLHLADHAFFFKTLSSLRWHFCFLNVLLHLHFLSKFNVTYSPPNFVSFIFYVFIFK